MALNQLKGTKEYLPEEQIVREQVLDTLKKIFKKYGYRPLETSILELYETAANKYAGGEEILKETYTLEDQGERKLCLRYELTFKLAKLVGLNPNIKMPLKRYEIGKVFRDGPVKTGRLREFTQCDVDCVGVSSVVVDAEIMALINDVFKELELDVVIEVNSRKLLFDIFKFAGIKEADYVAAALSLDKLVKFGEKTVRKELEEKGIKQDIIKKLFALLNDAEKLKDNKEKIGFLEKTLGENTEGIQEIKNFFIFVDNFKAKDVVLIPTLARGLGYYTGMMYEVFLKDKTVKSSLAAGGRWDNMIKAFLGSNNEYPSTGIAFGLEVIIEAMKLKKQKTVINDPKVYIIPINTLNECLNLASDLRKNNITCDIAFEKKLSKALDYANKKQIPFVLIVGDEEIKNQKFSLKELSSGKEEKLDVNSIIKKLENKDN